MMQEDFLHDDKEEDFLFSDEKKEKNDGTMEPATTLTNPNDNNNNNNSPTITTTPNINGSKTGQDSPRLLHSPYSSSSIVTPSSPLRFSTTATTSDEFDDKEEDEEDKERGNQLTSPSQRKSLYFSCPAIQSLVIIPSPKNKACFKIRTQFVNGKSYEVERGLKHFEWLHNVISNEYPGCIVPPKTLIQVHRDPARNLFLEKFIERIVLHEKLKTSKRLFEFLSLDTTVNMENYVGDDTPPVDSGLFFSFRKWKVSPQPRDTINEEACNYFKKMRDAMEALILNSKRLQVKQNEWIENMESIGRELKVFGNTDKQMHDRFHQIGDALMAMYTMDIGGSLSSSKHLGKQIKYTTTKFERTMEWYRSFLVPGVISCLELPQTKAAELQLGKDTLTDLEKRFEALEKKNADPAMAKNQKHVKAYQELKEQLEKQREYVDKISNLLKAIEKELPEELKAFRKTMEKELGEGLMQLVQSRIQSEKTQLEQYMKLKQ